MYVGWKALSRSFGTSIENASNYQHVGTDVLNNGRKVPVIVIGKFGVHPSISPTSDCGRTSSSCGNDDEVPIAVSGSKKRRRGRNKKLSHQ